MRDLGVPLSHDRERGVSCLRDLVLGAESSKNRNFLNTFILNGLQWIYVDLVCTFWHEVDKVY